MFSEFIKNINSWVRDILEMLQIKLGNHEL